jgi:hypothetical protein
MNGEKLLSILIPTIYGREEPFTRLYTKLQDQLYRDGIWNEVEIVVECDDRALTIGAKRQLLAEKGIGLFEVYIDDDDDIADDYCLAIWSAIKQDPTVDCIGFLQECTFNNGKPVLASLSNQWADWGENKGIFKYVRTPFFPTPIRREHILATGYSDIRYGEDHDFARRLKQSGLCTKEYFINKVMYYYKYVHQPHNIKYGGPIVTNK